MTNEEAYDIYDRAFDFAVKSDKLLDKLHKSMAIMEYSKQLIKASGSIGANIEEADGVLTRRDFINKMGIARRESRESRHWLRLIEATASFKEQVEKEELKWLIKESTEIMLILNSIIENTENKN